MQPKFRLQKRKRGGTDSQRQPGPPRGCRCRLSRTGVRRSFRCARLTAGASGAPDDWPQGSRRSPAGQRTWADEGTWTSRGPGKQGTWAGRGSGQMQTRLIPQPAPLARNPNGGPQRDTYTAQRAPKQEPRPGAQRDGAARNLRTTSPAGTAPARAQVVFGPKICPRFSRRPGA